MNRKKGLFPDEQTRKQKRRKRHWNEKTLRASRNKLPLLKKKH
jgi:hypothetical protein